MYFLILLVGIVAFIFLLYKFILSYSQKAVSRLVETKHRAAEEILKTGIAPHKWGKKGLTRLLNLGLPKLIAVWKLERIISYFQYTPLVEDEDTRELLLSRLRKIRDDWKSKEWKEIYPYE